MKLMERRSLLLCQQQYLAAQCYCELVSSAWSCTVLSR